MMTPWDYEGAILTINIVIDGLYWDRRLAMACGDLECLEFLTKQRDKAVRIRSYLHTQLQLQCAG
jgi:hypothetical protein